MATLGTLSGGQHDQSVGGTRTHLQLYVHRQHRIEDLVLRYILVDPMRYIRIAGEGGITYDYR